MSGFVFTRFVCGVLLIGVLIVACGCGGRISEPEPAPTPASESRETGPEAAPLAASDADHASSLASLMCERLGLMPDVARYKWNHRLPIHDPQRESELLERLIEQAEALDVPVDVARRFLQAQIEASKSIQQAHFERWERENAPMFANVPDLQTELRPQIGRLTDALLRALAEQTRKGAAPGDSATAPRRRRLLEEELRRCLPDDLPAGVSESLSDALP